MIRNAVRFNIEIPAVAPAGDRFEFFEGPEGRGDVGRLRPDRLGRRHEHEPRITNLGLPQVVTVIRGTLLSARGLDVVPMPGMCPTD